MELDHLIDLLRAKGVRRFEIDLSDGPAMPPPMRNPVLTAEPERESLGMPTREEMAELARKVSAEEVPSE